MPDGTGGGGGGVTFRFRLPPSVYLIVKSRPVPIVLTRMIVTLIVAFPIARAVRLSDGPRVE